MDLMRFGSFLAELRHEKGLTQQALGERLGGYKDLNVLEDVDLVTRLKRQAGRAGITRLTARAITSASVAAGAP